MNPSLIIGSGLVALAGAGMAYIAYNFSKIAIEDISDKYKEENRDYQRELAKP